MRLIKFYFKYSSLLYIQLKSQDSHIKIDLAFKAPFMVDSEEIKIEE